MPAWEVWEIFGERFLWKTATNCRRKTGVVKVERFLISSLSPQPHDRCLFLAYYCYPSQQLLLPVRADVLAPLERLEWLYLSFNVFEMLRKRFFLVSLQGMVGLMFQVRHVMILMQK